MTTADLISQMRREIDELRRRIDALERKVSPGFDRYGVHDTARVGSLRDRIKVHNA